MQQQRLLQGKAAALGAWVAPAVALLGRRHACVDWVLLGLPARQSRRVQVQTPAHPSRDTEAQCRAQACTQRSLRLRPCSSHQQGMRLALQVQCRREHQVAARMGIQVQVLQTIMT